MCGLCGSVNTARFLTVHSSKVCCPLTSLHVRRSPKPFLAILEYCKESKSEAGEGLGIRLCILFASYPACCQDYAVCHFLRLYRLRQPTRSRLGPTKTQCWLKFEDLCSMRFTFSRAKGRRAVELEEARVECAGCLCTLGCKSGCSTTRKRASNPGAT